MEKTNSRKYLTTLGVLIFAGTNFRESIFLWMFEVQFFVFGLLSFAKIAKIAKISNREN